MAMDTSNTVDLTDFQQVIDHVIVQMQCTHIQCKPIVTCMYSQPTTQRPNHDPKRIDTRKHSVTSHTPDTTYLTKISSSYSPVPSTLPSPTRPYQYTTAYSDNSLLVQ